jgi:hypothetical protein
LVFGGDWKQILPVIVKGSRPQIVGACLQRSQQLWSSIKVLKLTKNMRLNTQNIAERDFAKWQLEVGHGKHTDPTGSITLPDHFKCPENNISSLIQTIYPGIDQLPLQPDPFSPAGMMMLMTSMKHCLHSFLDRRENSLVQTQSRMMGPMMKGICFIQWSISIQSTALDCHSQS